MFKLITDLYESFKIGPSGFSGRKLSAFATIVMASYAHKFVTAENLSNVLIIDLAFIAVALSIVTAEQIIKLKNGSDEKPSPDNADINSIK